MTTHQAIERLCALAHKVHCELCPSWADPCDCFCKGFPGTVDNDTIEFIEQAVNSILEVNNASRPKT